MESFKPPSFGETSDLCLLSFTLSFLSTTIMNSAISSLSKPLYDFSAVHSLLVAIKHIMSYHTAYECPSLPLLANGQISFSFIQVSPVEFDRAATYSCLPGFEITGGNVTRICRGDESNPFGQWSGTAPTCEGT